MELSTFLIRRLQIQENFVRSLSGAFFARMNTRPKLK